MKKILAFSGSNSENSVNTKLVKYAVESNRKEESVETLDTEEEIIETFDSEQHKEISALDVVKQIIYTILLCKS